MTALRYIIGNDKSYEFDNAQNHIFGLFFISLQSFHQNKINENYGKKDSLTKLQLSKARTMAGV